MKNVLVIGLTVPQTIADPDGSNPATHLGGAAPAMAKSLMNGGHLRTTLLTVLQRDDLGKATIRMLNRVASSTAPSTATFPPSTRSYAEGRTPNPITIPPTSRP